MSRTLVTGFIVLVVACRSVAAAETVTGTYQPVTNGYLVEFVVHNTFSYGLGRWSVTTLDATSPAEPAGWRSYQTPREVSWDNSMNHALDIPPGQSLGGFGYTSSNPPGTLMWWAAGDGGTTGYLTPVLVPETSSLAALLAGLAGFGAMRRRRR
jgi:hypothetical protein